MKKMGLFAGLLSGGGRGAFPPQGGGENLSIRGTVRFAETNEQIKFTSWSADRRGKRSQFYIAN